MTHEKHQEMLSELESRVLSKFPDEPVYREQVYMVGDHIRGEIDLKRYTARSLIIYEVKSYQGYAKACLQFQRFCHYHKNIDIKGIYIGTDGVKRMH